MAHARLDEAADPVMLHPTQQAAVGAGLIKVQIRQHLLKHQLLAINTTGASGQIAQRFHLRHIIRNQIDPGAVGMGRIKALPGMHCGDSHIMVQTVHTVPVNVILLLAHKAG